MKKVNNAQATLSEITVGSDKKAHFTCMVPCETEISIIVHDAKGRSRLQQKFQLGLGHNQLSFSLSGFSVGDYNAWIDVLGNTYIRPIDVEGTAVVGGGEGIFSKVKEWLGFM